jgi:hypothetical protein
MLRFSYKDGDSVFLQNVGIHLHGIRIQKNQNMNICIL